MQNPSQPLLDDDAPEEFAEPDHLTEGEIAGITGRSLLVDDEPPPDDIDEAMPTLTPAQGGPSSWTKAGDLAGTAAEALAAGDEETERALGDYNRGPHNYPLAPVVPAEPEDALEQQGLSLTEQAMRLQITDPATFARAEELLRVLADFAQKVTEFFAEDIANAHKTWSTLTAKRKKQLDPLLEAKQTLSARYAEFNRAEKLRAERERAEREAAALKAEQERLAAEAAQLEAQAEAVPTVEQAQELRQEAAQVRHEAATVQAPVIPINRAVAPSKGISAREKWTFEVTDKAAIVKAVAAGTLSLEALDVNPVYFRARATADKGTVTIPGVRFYDAGSVAVRRK